MRMRVGITDYVPAPFDLERAEFPDTTEFVFLDAVEEADFDFDKLEGLDALLVWHAHISSRVADALKNCKIVVRYGVGYDNIDVGALQRNDILFCNTPDYGTEEVADTAVAMALALSRSIFAYDQLAKGLRADWQENTIAGIQRLSDCTVGVIGVGRIGSSVMRRFRPFGAKLVGFDPYQLSGHEKALGYERVGRLQDLLAVADIVSLHCPLTEETTGLVDEAFLADMKPSSILVNTARGGLLASTDALLESLKSKHLGGLGLDVLPEEPPGDDKLFVAWRQNAPEVSGRLLINPHTAYFSEQAWLEMRKKTAETAFMYLSEGIARNIVSV